MNKEIEIYKYSNPQEVLKKAYKLLGNNIDLALSTRKDKKYMIRGDFTENKWIHFGQMDYEDYTKHKNKVRLIKFRQRNSKWKDSKPNTASYLSYYLLW